MKKTTTILCIVFVVVMLLSLPMSAATSYYTYTYSISGTALRSPDAYTPDREVDVEYMGLNDLNKLAELYPDKTEEELIDIRKKKLSFVDVEVDEEKNVYIVDRDNNRVIVLDPYYKVTNIIDTFYNANGNQDAIKAPEGIFVSGSKIVNGERVASKVYVCDTGNSRILVFDTEGNFIKSIAKPKTIKHKYSANIQGTLSHQGDLVACWSEQSEGAGFCDIIQPYVEHYSYPHFAKVILDGFNSKMQEIKSLVNVLFQNIDAIIVNEADYQRLQQLGYVHPTELGKLKVEHIFSSVKFYNKMRWEAVTVDGEVFKHCC